MDYEDDNEKAIEVHQPCDSCGSSDALAVYSNHTFCHSCSKHTFTDKREASKMEKLDWTPVVGTVKALKARGITEETCKKFSYSIGTYSGEKVQVATYKRDGHIVGQKIRTKSKDFRWLGETDPPLFGQNLWKPGGKRLVITEGEIDAMSMSQVQENKWPVVSLPNGAASASRAVKNNLEYINSFDKVVLMFDNDEAGLAATEKCATLIAPGKCCIASLPLKDANECLLAGKRAELISAMWNASPYTPEGIVNGADLLEEMLVEQEEGLSYPWIGMTKALHGIRTDEIVTVIAGTGIGKSQVFKEVAYHLLTEHREKVGLFFMEESNRTTALNFTGMAANKPIHLPEHDISKEEKEKHFNDVFSDGRCFLYNHFGSATFDDIVSRMRYLRVSCDVKYIFIDHLACFTVSEEAIKDERKELDTIISTLASLCRELGITIFLISHLNSGSGTISHEEGGRVSLRDIRGTRGIGQWSSQIICLERNQQEEDPILRNQTTMRVLKDRFAGNVGDTLTLTYNAKTGRIKETDAIEHSPFKPVDDNAIKESTNEYDF
jgi:twinkle protein